MSLVKINALTVPAAGGDEITKRFEHALGHLPDTPGFERFELLRPTDGKDTWLVLTHWSDEESFQAWKSGSDHARSHKPGVSGRQPVATGAELSEFEPVLFLAVEETGANGS